MLVDDLAAAVVALDPGLAVTLITAQGDQLSGVNDTTGQ